MPPKAKAKSPAPETDAPDAGEKPPVDPPADAAPPPADPPAPETDADVAGEHVVILRQNAALGNGDRKKGDVLCAITRGEDGHLDFENAEPAKGVAAIELRTAFNNLQLLDVVPLAREDAE